MPPVPAKLVPQSSIYILGEAPGETEEREGSPFVGASGRLLTTLLQMAGIDRGACSLGNVLLSRPPDNKIDAFCGKKADMPAGYDYPALSQGAYLLPQYLPEVAQALKSIASAKPNLVIALGNTACWATLGRTGVSSLRGFIHISPVLGCKVLPTYHPASLFRQWNNWPIVQQDLVKARLESSSASFSRPERWVSVAESAADCYSWWAENETDLVSVDIETKAGQITSISFATSLAKALVIPFWTSQGSVFDLATELELWHFIRFILSNPAIAKLFHNGIYDLSYLCFLYKLPIRGIIHDTLQLHHALQPEVQKSLGFLGSLYTREAAWKLMRLGQHTNKEAKKDD